MAAPLNLTAQQGKTFTLDFRVKTNNEYMNFTGYVARMQVRPDVYSSTKLLDLSTAGGQITLDSSGNVHVRVSAAVMANVIDGKHVYDLEVESAGGEVTGIIEGKFRVKPEVTR